MAEPASIRATVRGRVQGVFFRASTRQKAESLGLTGWVRNLPDGMTVEVEAEGEKESLESFSRWLNEGPPGARIESVSLEQGEYTGGYSDFSIRY